MYEFNKCQFVHDENSRIMIDIQNNKNLNIEKQAEQIEDLLLEGITDDDEDLLILRKALLRIWPDPPS